MNHVLLALSIASAAQLMSASFHYGQIDRSLASPNWKMRQRIDEARNLHWTRLLAPNQNKFSDSSSKASATSVESGGYSSDTDSSSNYYSSTLSYFSGSNSSDSDTVATGGAGGRGNDNGYLIANQYSTSLCMDGILQYSAVYKIGSCIADHASSSSYMYATFQALSTGNTLLILCTNYILTLSTLYYQQGSLYVILSTPISSVVSLQRCPLLRFRSQVCALAVFFIPMRRQWIICPVESCLRKWHMHLLPVVALFIIIVVDGAGAAALMLVLT